MRASLASSARRRPKKTKTSEGSLSRSMAHARSMVRALARPLFTFSFTSRSSLALPMNLVGSKGPGNEVIGDTPDDVACARHFGARAVAVATGHLYGVDELRACEPDAVLPDFSNTEQVTHTL